MGMVQSQLSRLKMCYYDDDDIILVVLRHKELQVAEVWSNIAGNSCTFLP
jgi:hypothetical protein